MSVSDERLTTRRRAAVSTAVAPLLDGPPTTGRVLAAFDAAVHVDTGDPELPLICLATPAAVHLPCAVMLARLPAARVGDPVSLGAGRLLLGELEIVPARWVAPPLPRLLDVPGAVRRAAGLPLSFPGTPFLPGTPRVEPGTELVTGVRTLLGRGPGLTPAGDDMLAGAIVTWHAAGEPAAAALAAAVAAAHPLARTTTVSAALLGHAARGECIPELATLLAALDGRADLPAAAAALSAVGDTSGTALLTGVCLALRGLSAAKDQPR